MAGEGFCSGKHGPKLPPPTHTLLVPVSMENRLGCLGVVVHRSVCLSRSPWEPHLGDQRRCGRVTHTSPPSCTQKGLQREGLGLEGQRGPWP